MRLTIFIILLLIITPTFAKKNYEREVDSLLEESNNYFVKLQFVESLEISKQALSLSSKNKYSKGKTYSYLYIAKVLKEFSLILDALAYLEKTQAEPYAKKDASVQAEIYKIRGRIASSQQLYSFEKECYLKQLKISDRIDDLKQKKRSKIQAYFYIQHLYAKQSQQDSVKVYQRLLEKELLAYVENDKYYYLSALYADKGVLYINLGKYKEAAQELDKSLQVITNSNSSFFVYTMQIYGDLEIARGDTAKAILHYKKALTSSITLNINHKSKQLHEKLADCFMHNENTLDEAKMHKKEFKILSDSLEYHNRQVVDIILSEIINEKDEAAQKSRVFFMQVVGGMLMMSSAIGILLIGRNRRNNKSLKSKTKMLSSSAERVVELEKELDNNAFNDIIELAKSNNPEFLPLFSKSYPEFIVAIKKLDPNIKNSELSFFALAFLNFSTKDIAAFTFVTPRAVQIRKNRMRKKYDIPSEVDFNKWTRELLLVQNSYRVVT